MRRSQFPRKTVLVAVPLLTLSLVAGCGGGSTAAVPTPASLMARVPGCAAGDPGRQNQSLTGSLMAGANSDYVRQDLTCTVPGWDLGTLDVLSFTHGGEKPWLVSAGASSTAWANNVLYGPGWAAVLDPQDMPTINSLSAAHRELGGKWLGGQP